MDTREKAPSSPGGDEQLAAVAVTCYGLTSSEQRGGGGKVSQGQVSQTLGSLTAQRYRDTE